MNESRSLRFEGELIPRRELVDPRNYFDDNFPEENTAPQSAQPSPEGKNRRIREFLVRSRDGSRFPVLHSTYRVISASFSLF